MATWLYVRWLDVGLLLWLYVATWLYVRCAHDHTMQVLDENMAYFTMQLLNPKGVPVYEYSSIAFGFSATASGEIEMSLAPLSASRLFSSQSHLFHLLPDRYQFCVISIAHAGSITCGRP